MSTNMFLYFNMRDTAKATLIKLFKVDVEQLVHNSIHSIQKQFLEVARTKELYIKTNSCQIIDPISILCFNLMRSILEIIA